jgi:ferritin-like metal-binding protein YciE
MPIEAPQELPIYKLQAIKDAEMQATEALKRLMPEIENPELQELIERRQDQGREILTAVGPGSKNSVAARRSRAETRLHAV